MIVCFDFSVAAAYRRDPEHLIKRCGCRAAALGKRPGWSMISAAMISEYERRACTAGNESSKRSPHASRSHDALWATGSPLTYP